MREAIKQAQKAAAIGEVPIGAVIVHGGKIIARGYNKRETRKNALLHAEVAAIDKACRRLGGWRLPECEMYVTLEPCPMCMGAIISARIERVYFGAYDQKSGACGSACDVSQSLPHKPILALLHSSPVQYFTNSHAASLFLLSFEIESPEELRILTEVFPSKEGIFATS